MGTLTNTPDIAGREKAKFRNGATEIAVGVVPEAGEVHVGEVGGNSKVITPTIAVSTSPAYTAGDVIGGKQTLTNMLRASGKDAVLLDINISDNANQKPVGDLIFFNADPSAATTTDNAAFAWSTDFSKMEFRVPVTSADWKTIGSKGSFSISNLGRVIELASGADGSVVFVTDSTPTFGATTDIIAKYGFLRD